MPLYCIQIFKPFEFQGCVFKPGFAMGTTRVYMPCSKEEGLAVFDCTHFIDDNGSPRTDLQGEMIDPKTGEALSSLEGYIGITHGFCQSSAYI